MPRAITTVPLKMGIFTSVSTVFGIGIAAMATMYDAPADPFGGAPVIEVVMYRDAGVYGGFAPQPIPVKQDTKTAASKTETSAAPQATREPSPIHTTQEPSKSLAQTETVKISGEATQTSADKPSAPAPTTSAAASVPAPVAATEGSDSRRGSETSGARSQAADDEYEARVIRWIDQHKKHPGRVNGVVTVKFIVDRHGRMRDARITQSSGDGRLDQLALAQLREAAPLPRPARTVTWHTREMQVRLDYRKYA